MNWHGKHPEVKVINIVKSVRTPSNKIALANNRIVKTEIIPKTERTSDQKVVQTIHYSNKEREIAKSISYNSISNTNKVVPENNTPKNKVPEKTISRRGVLLAIVCCLLGIIGAFLVTVIIASAPFFSGASIAMGVALSYALIPFLLLFASLFFSNMAMANGYNKGLIACIILDSIFLLILVFAVSSIKQ